MAWNRVIAGSKKNSRINGYSIIIIKKNVAPTIKDSSIVDARTSTDDLIVKNHIDACPSTDDFIVKNHTDASNSTDDVCTNENEPYTNEN